MTRLIICRGLPASGKTTVAKKWVHENPIYRIRVNRDDLRAMMHDSVYLKRDDAGTYTSRKEAAKHGTEQTVIRMRDKIIYEALCSGIDVISDDTNLYAKPVKDLQRIAYRCGADVEFIDLTHVSVETCLERNETRLRSVPDTVIRDMYGRYVKGKGYPLPVPALKDNDKVANMVPYEQPSVVSSKYKPAVIFDIDGTVAHMNGRSPYDYTQVHTDVPDDVLRELVDMYQAVGYHIIFLSGRKSECRELTVKWLQEHFGLSGTGVYSSLFMRPDGDNRADQIVKYELFDQYVRPYYAVRCVYDDRNRVVDMWRQLGLKCLQVEPGDF